MNLLLDTHTFLWWLSGDESLSDAARTAIADEGNIIFVSAASAWEIATKHRIGKLSGVAVVVIDIDLAIADQGFIGLPIGVHRTQIAGDCRGLIATRPTESRSLRRCWKGSCSFPTNALSTLTAWRGFGGRRESVNSGDVSYLSLMRRRFFRRSSSMVGQRTEGQTPDQVCKLRNPQGNYPLHWPFFRSAAHCG